jgi:uncharacterized protein (DUF736 family)
MSTIGTFTKNGDRYEGTIRTLTLNVSASIVPIERDSDSENAPDHRVYSGPAVFGAAWSRTSKADNFYLSVQLDDPSMTAPIFANLLLSEGDTWHLVWNRPK